MKFREIVGGSRFHARTNATAPVFVLALIEQIDGSPGAIGHQTFSVRPCPTPSYRTIQIDGLSLLPHNEGLGANWKARDEFAFLSQPSQGDIQSDLFYDYRTSVDANPTWQAWMRKTQPRLLVVWGKHDLSFELTEPEAYRRDVPKAEVHVLDAGHGGHFAAWEQPELFVGEMRKGFKSLRTNT